MKKSRAIRKKQKTEAAKEIRSQAMRQVTDSRTKAKTLCEERKALLNPRAHSDQETRESEVRTLPCEQLKEWVSRNWRWLKKLISVLTLVSVAIYTGITYRMWQSSNDTALRQLRAYVGFVLDEKEPEKIFDCQDCMDSTSIPLNYQPDSRRNYTALKFHNYGTTPAYESSICGGVWRIETQLHGTLPKDVLEHVDSAFNDCEKRPFPTISPTEDKPSREGLSRDEILAIQGTNSGQNDAVLIFRIQYVDAISKTKHDSYLCLIKHQSTFLACWNFPRKDN